MSPARATHCDLFSTPARAVTLFAPPRCLSPRVRVGLGEIAVKLADGVPRRMPRCSVMPSYEFDGFSGTDEFLVVDMGLSFDCILGTPWLARYQPDIGWLTRSVKRFRRLDVSAVSAHLESTMAACGRHGLVVGGPDPARSERWSSLRSVRAGLVSSESGRARFPATRERGRAGAPAQCARAAASAPRKCSRAVPPPRAPSKRG